MLAVCFVLIKVSTMPSYRGSIFKFISIFVIERKQSMGQLKSREGIDEKLYMFLLHRLLSEMTRGL
jgi:hypothetical protein